MTQAQAPSLTEDRADHHRRAAVVNIEQAGASLWRAGFHAWRMWGLYERYALKAIAEDAKKDVASIENYCHAYDLFADLARFGIASDVRHLRRNLTPSHFWQMWSLRNTHPYKVTLDKCLVYLSLASLHNWTVNHMLEEMRKALRLDRSPRKWGTLVRSLRVLAEEVLVRDEASQKLQSLARKLLNELEISDGFGSSVDAVCPDCGEPTMYLAHPGDFRCSNCDG